MRRRDPVFRKPPFFFAASHSSSDVNFCRVAAYDDVRVAVAVSGVTVEERVEGVLGKFRSQHGTHVVQAPGLPFDDHSNVRTLGVVVDRGSIEAEARDGGQDSD